MNKSSIPFLVLAIICIVLFFIYKEWMYSSFIATAAFCFAAIGMFINIPKENG